MIKLIIINNNDNIFLMYYMHVKTKKIRFQILQFYHMK